MSRRRENERERYWVHSAPEDEPTQNEMARSAPKVDEKRLCVCCSSDWTAEDPKHKPHDGYLTCYPCKRRIDERLADLLELYALTEGELQPGRGSGSGGRSSGQSIGLRVAALNTLNGADLLGILGEWEDIWRLRFGHADAHPRMLIDAQGYKIRAQKITRSLAEIVDYLRTWLDQACRTPYPVWPGPIDEPYGIDPDTEQTAGQPNVIDIAAFETAIRLLHGEVKTAARIVYPPTWHVDCPADTDNGICGANLRIDPATIDADVHCRACGRRWTTRWLMRVAEAESKTAIHTTVADAALHFGVSDTTIKRLARAGKITREHGQVILSEVREALHQQKRA